VKIFIVYNNKGSILRTGSCPDKDFSKQAQAGEFVMEGVANDIKQKVVDGKVVDKSPEEIEAEKQASASVLRQQDAEVDEMVMVSKIKFEELVKRVERLEAP
jgi:hypothetical protein